MAIGFSNTVKTAMADYALGNAVPSANATVWVCLGTGTYTDTAVANGTVTEVTTSNWTNYARVSVTNNATNWPAASTNTGTSTVTKSNGTAVTFTANATVTGTGPTPSYFFITNSATLNAAANIIGSGPLTSGNTAIVNGNAVSFAISALVMTIA